MKYAAIALLTFLLLSSFLGFKSPTEVSVPLVRMPDLFGEMEKHVETVKRGEFLGPILGRSLPGEVVHSAVAELSTIFSPKSVYPGWQVTFINNREGFTGGVTVRSTDGWSVNLSRWHGPWEVDLTAGISRLQPSFVTGTIQSSLMQSFQESGLPVQLVVGFASIFQWDVDFFRDIREGDRFSLLYLTDSRGTPGTILYAQLTNAGREYAAIRYDGGYYDLSGSPMKKAFRKAPLDVARISSRFSSSRLHPVLKRRMPHYGVDYAAPTGTPVVATGSGKVVFRGTKRGWGRSITIQHPNRIRTSYLHLNGYAKGVRKGSHVSEGQVIGYVGMTGLATGPHVDYRITINGKYVNPLNFQSPPLPPLPPDRREEFLLVAKRFMSRWPA